MIPYTIINYNAKSGNLTIRLQDVLGDYHELVVSAKGMMKQEAGEGYIQNNFSNLTDNQRELLMTGIPANVWDNIFKEK